MRRTRVAQVVAIVLAAVFVATFATVGTNAGAAAPTTVTAAFSGLVTSFDPPTDWDIVATWIHSNIGDCLVWRDRKTGAFVPWLAERWQRVNDTTWRFYLRKGVKFTDGEPFDANAAKFTIDRILADPKMLVNPQWTFIKSTQVVDPLTLEVVTAAPEPAMLSKMSGTGCQEIPPAYMQQVGA